MHVELTAWRYACSSKRNAQGERTCHALFGIVGTMSKGQAGIASIKHELDEANKLFALKKYESAADLLASALESMYVFRTLTHEARHVRRGWRRTRTCVA